MSRWLVAAYVFQDEFTELLGKYTDVERTASQLLANTSAVLKDSKELETAFKSMLSDKAWTALATALAHFKVIDASEELSDY